MKFKKLGICTLVILFIFSLVLPIPVLANSNADNLCIVTLKSSHGQNFEPLTVERGNSIPNLPIPESHDNIAFTFEGWYKDPNFETKWHDDDVVTKDITLYAKWQDDSINFHDAYVAPSFSSGGDITVDEDSGDYNKLWATNIRRGDEFTITPIEGFEILDTQPSISKSGKLSFKPKANTSGEAVFEVFLKNSSNNSNSLKVSFKIIVSALHVDKPIPTFKIGKDCKFPESSNPTPILLDKWATISNGGSQQISFKVDSESDLFIQSPNLDNSGNLFFTLEPNKTGTATIKVNIIIDGKIDTSTEQSFKITVYSIRSITTPKCTSLPTIIQNTAFQVSISYIGEWTNTDSFLYEWQSTTDPFEANAINLGISADYLILPASEIKYVRLKLTGINNNSANKTTVYSDWLHVDSPNCTITKWLNPIVEGPQDANIDITVDTSISIFPINVEVSPKAIWKLYKDYTLTDEITNKTMNLTSGENIAYLNVASEDFLYSRTYTIKIHKSPAPSTECSITKWGSLPNVHISGTTINSTFDFFTKLFILKVEVSPHATWSLYEDFNCSSPLSQYIFLEYGMNTVYVKVTAEDGHTSKIYTINMERPNDPCEVIDWLHLSNSSIIGDNVYKRVTSNIDSLPLDIIVNPNATWGLYSDLECKYRLDSNTLKLTFGDNIAYLKITSKDLKYTKIYTINVNRADSIFGSNPPVCNIKPFINSTTKLGDYIYSTDGTWTDAHEYSYAWQISDTPSNQGVRIKKYDGLVSMPLRNDSIGKYIRLEVTAMNTTNNTSAIAYSNWLYIDQDDCKVIEWTNLDPIKISGNTVTKEVDTNVCSLPIEVIVSDGATWKLYSDSTCSKETESNTLNLNVGSNVAYLKVTAEDGITSKIYTITINRLSSYHNYDPKDNPKDDTNPSPTPHPKPQVKPEPKPGLPNSTVKKPIISSDNVLLSSNNSDSSNYAGVGDMLILKFKPTQKLSKPKVTINGKEVTSTENNGVWIVSYTLTNDDQEGFIKVSVSEPSSNINPEGINYTEITPVFFSKSNNRLTDDEFYKMCYFATMKSLESKSQKDINYARKLIASLPPSLSWAKGELSKQVDTIQHQLLVNIASSIEKAKKQISQKNINEARRSIPSDLPEIWRNSYSQAIDTIQQKLISQASISIEIAKISKNEKDIKKAQDLIDELKTVENNDNVKTLIENLSKDFNQSIKK